MELIDFLFNFAYLDAGTGSLIIQGLIGIIAAVGYFFRHTLRVFISKIFKRSPDVESKDTKK